MSQTLAVVVEWSSQRLAEWVADQEARLTTYGDRAGWYRAKLHLVPTSAGGRRKSIYSGFRASWHWGERNEDGLAVHHDAPLVFEGADRLGPGGEAMIRLYPLRPELWHRIRAGSTLELREGARVCGEATIVAWVGPGESDRPG